jgi:hypothetical protein
MLTACQMAADLGAPSDASSLKVAGDGKLPIQCIRDARGNCAPIANEPAPPSAKPPPSGRPPASKQAAAAPPCEKDFWGNCQQPSAGVLPSLIPGAQPPAPAAPPPGKGGAKTASAQPPCQKDFWGNCAPPPAPTPSLLPPSISLPSILSAPAPQPPGPPDKKAADDPAQPCQKDFWGNCAQMIPTVHSSPGKPDAGVATPKGNCVRDFWGNCTPVASNRHPYRWRYVRPGNRAVAAANPDPPVNVPSAGSSAGGGGRVEQAGPPAVCHPKRRVVGEEQPTTEQAQLSAEQAWMGSVRYDFGERYQNLAMAKDVRYTCTPSSAKSGLKRAMFRCATEAIPCRPGGN